MHLARIELWGREFDGVVHRSEGAVILGSESRPPDAGASVLALYSGLRGAMAELEATARLQLSSILRRKGWSHTWSTLSGFRYSGVGAALVLAYLSVHQPNIRSFLSTRQTGIEWPASNKSGRSLTRGTLGLF